MIVKEVCQVLEELAPLAYAEDFDNVGLLVGDYQEEVSGILVTLDTLEAVVDEAIEKNCNLIVSFHPIIFGGLKQLNYIGGEILLKTRKRTMYGLGLGIDQSLQPALSGRMYWKIGKK